MTGKSQSGRNVRLFLVNRRVRCVDFYANRGTLITTHTATMCAPILAALLVGSNHPVEAASVQRQAMTTGLLVNNRNQC